MPRKKRTTEADLLDASGAPILALPPVRPSSHSMHEHEKDPYALPQGAVPGRISNLKTLARTPLERELTPQDKGRRELARIEQKEKARRYELYLDKLIETGYDRRAALVEVYGEEAVAQRGIEDLQSEVREGVGSSEIGAIMERFDVNATARVRVVASWLYSDNAGASLKAADMLAEMSGDTTSDGSFEMYLRLSKEHEIAQKVKGARK